jgi:hypothetical protein
MIDTLDVNNYNSITYYKRPIIIIFIELVSKAI